MLVVAVLFDRFGSIACAAHCRGVHDRTRRGIAGRHRECRDDRDALAGLQRPQGARKRRRARAGVAHEREARRRHVGHGDPGGFAWPGVRHDQCVGDGRSRRHARRARLRDLHIGCERDRRGSAELRRVRGAATIGRRGDHHAPGRQSWRQRDGEAKSLGKVGALADAVDGTWPVRAESRSRCPAGCLHRHCR